MVKLSLWSCPMVLDGREMAGYIQERHIRTVRGLQTTPTLAIVMAGSHKPSQAYASLKQRYGEEICADVRVVTVGAEKSQIIDTIIRLGSDISVHGIIVQLPLPDPAMTDEVLAAIPPAKDVDGLGPHADYDAASPAAILWLLAGYAVDLKSKTILVVGQGRLVGAPLTRLLHRDGFEPTTADEHTKDLPALARSADIIITAVGQPGLISSDMVSTGAVVIDAGTADSAGGLRGDCDPTLYERRDIKISPVPGGVGPMTVALLFEHLLRAAT